MKDMNHYDTFIQVAEDCPVSEAIVLKVKGEARTIPVIQYEMLSSHPYRFTQEDVLFEVFAERNQISEQERAAAREKFFSKGQPCLRTSSLGKRYGWGIHHDAQGKVAIHAIESEEYVKLMNDRGITQCKAMRSKRA
ncbi:DUF6157 family protein [Paenibacillus sp. NPDC093718]|uniref:DUF6157 family protein n=1 Tax=Paenibacillus sp. NPDC093718 TaxID=3390601 RepID=UPI003CFFB993